MKAKEVEIGQTFGKLTVIGDADTGYRIDSKGRICRIDSKGRRCTTHGLSKTPLFKIWGYMKTRCENKRATAYKWYGGRGVKICDAWKSDFKSFYDWAILNGWKKGMTIDKDKIPLKLGKPAVLYSPEMCCFITHKENSNARRGNHRITYNGETKNMTQWEAELFSGKEVLYNRITRNKWSLERAFTQPLRKS